MAAFDHPGTTWNRVSPKYVYISVVADILTALVFGGFAAVMAIWFEWPFAAWVWPAAIALFSLVSMVFEVRRMRAIGYQLREDDLLFRRGLFWSRLVAVPYGRMQLVDVQQGPIARMFGLASLKMVTAAAVTGVAIPGIPLAEAEQLRDHLIRLAETRRAGL